MTIGISKESLIDRQDIAIRVKDYIRSTLLDEIINDCKELNLWLPITDKTRNFGRVLLLYPELPDTPRQCIGEWVAKRARYVADQVISPCIQPTHYKLLSEAPKE